MSKLPEAPGVIYWFRQDLRMHDQPALQQAVKYALDHRVWLLPVYIADADQDSQTAWDFVRVGPVARPGRPWLCRACLNS